MLLARIARSHDLGMPIAGPCFWPGLTALHFAAANGHASVVEMLLRRGAAVDVKGKNGWGPGLGWLWGGEA